MEVLPHGEWRSDKRRRVSLELLLFWSFHFPFLFILYTLQICNYIFGYV